MWKGKGFGDLFILRDGMGWDEPEEYWGIPSRLVSREFHHIPSSPIKPHPILSSKFPEMGLIYRECWPPWTTIGEGLPLSFAPDP